MLVSLEKWMYLENNIWYSFLISNIYLQKLNTKLNSNESRQSALQIMTESLLVNKKQKTIWESTEPI